MSYIRADEILPKELLEAIQQYADGKVIYIPRKEKQEWGSGTSARSSSANAMKESLRLIKMAQALKNCPTFFLCPKKAFKEFCGN